MQELRGENTQQKLFDQLEEVLDPATEPATRKELLQPCSEDNKQMFFNLKSIIQDNAFSLNKDRQLVSTKKNSKPDQKIYGVQFSTFTFYCMSQGLLDPKALEMIQNRTTLDEVVLAPSYILREAW